LGGLSPRVGARRRVRQDVGRGQPRHRRRRSRATRCRRSR
jgi:hypothetical protein